MARTHDYAADRQYLARVSSQTGIQINAKSNAYAHRIASRLRAQEARGVALSVQAARGHRVTPEHGARGARPRLPAPVVSYGGPPKSKYVNRTQPLVHKRLRGIARKVTFDRGVVYTVRTEREVWKILDEWKPDDRVSLTGYDCSTNKWITVFINEKRTLGAGARIDYVRDLVRESGMSLEDFMVVWTQDEYRGQALTHVCAFQLHVYPRETQQAREISRRARRLI